MTSVLHLLRVINCRDPPVSPSLYRAEVLWVARTFLAPLLADGGCVEAGLVSLRRRGVFVHLPVGGDVMRDLILLDDPCSICAV